MFIHLATYLLSTYRVPRMLQVLRMKPTIGETEFLPFSFPGLEEGGPSSTPDLIPVFLLNGPA